MVCQEEKSKSLLSTFDTQYSNNPTFHHSIWIAQIYRGKKHMIPIYCRNPEEFNSRSELLFRTFAPNSGEMLVWHRPRGS